MAIVKPAMTGTSGPINADGGPQRAGQASSTDIEREDAICEFTKIMQMPPGSSDDAALIDRRRAFGNTGWPGARQNEHRQGTCGICAATRRPLLFDLANQL
jgi:hypothetical protein